MNGIQKALLCIAVVVLMLFTGFGASLSTPLAAAEMTVKWSDKLGKPIHELIPATELPIMSAIITMKPKVTAYFPELEIATTTAPGLDFDFDLIDPGSVDIWLPTPLVTITSDTTVT